MKRILLWCAALFLMSAQAQAQELELHTTPDSPVAAQPFSLHAMGGGCHAFLNLDPQDREISVAGNVISVTVPYEHTGVCVIPPLQHQWTIPGVPAGAYTLELHGEDDDFPRQLLDTIDIVVVPGSTASLPTVVPATSWWAMLLLLSTIVAIAARRQLGKL